MSQIREIKTDSIELESGTLDGSSGGGGATTALDNLASVSINESLVPADLTKDLGSSSLLWLNIFVDQAKDVANTTVIDFANRVLADSSGGTAIDFNSTTDTIFGKNLVPDTGGSRDIGQAMSDVRSIFIGTSIENASSFTFVDFLNSRINATDGDTLINLSTRNLYGINNVASIDLDQRSLLDGTGDLALSYTFSDQITIRVNIATNDSRALFLEANTGGVGLIALDNSSGTYYLPMADGSSGDVLSTDGSGNMSWAPPPSPENVITPDDNAGTNSIAIETGDGTGGFGSSSGSISIITGDAISDISGGITIRTGAAGITRGNISIEAAQVTISSDGDIVLQGIVDYNYTASKNRAEQSGPTASRPGTTLPGLAYFDTDLGIPIWHNGTNWIDATGTTV